MAAHPKRAHPNAALPIQWEVVAWFAFVHFVGLVMAPLYLGMHYRWPTVALAIVLFMLAHLTVSAGMHRLYAHRSYRASKPLELFFLLFGAATFQVSMLVWAYQHRMHHWRSDTDEDPYSIVHGFWWAHFLWILHPSKQQEPEKLKDLLANPLVVWQHQYYFRLSILMTFVLPTCIAALWGDAIGGLLVAGFMRLVFQYHLTWCINSVAHTFGHRHYGPAGSARFSTYLALVVMGEHNHERHHLAERDYRVGIKWYHIDLGRWFIELCARLNLAHDLKTVSEEEIRLRIRAQRKPDRAELWPGAARETRAPVLNAATEP
ncbi:MAG: hypothetical protein JOZ16_00380 [Methylobacteriaceae bacterium]|nr:hypothetical protein [Methylobacteriaceae bacterium]